MNPYYQYGQNFQNQNQTFIPVNSEQEVLTYPVGCGNSVSFKLQNAPYIYTKTMGFSQFEKPVIEKYRLVKEEPEEAKPVDYQSEIDRIWEEINFLKERRNERKPNTNVSTKPNGNVKSEI